MYNIYAEKNISPKGKAHGFSQNISPILRNRALVALLK